MTAITANALSPSISGLYLLFFAYPAVCIFFLPNFECALAKLPLELGYFKVSTLPQVLGKSYCHVICDSCIHHLPPFRALMHSPPQSSPPQSTRYLLLGIWSHLSSRRRTQLACLLLVMLASGGAELLSLGAVLPFLAVLTDPERLWRQPWVQVFAAQVGFTQASDSLVPASIAFGLAAVLASLIRLANQWLNGRLAAAVAPISAARFIDARSINPIPSMYSGTAPR